MNRKVLVLSIISMSLVSCRASRYPVFKDYSEYVNYKDFYEHLNSGEFFEYLKFNESFSGKAHSIYITSRSAKVGESVLYENSGKQEEKHTFKYDANNMRSYLSVEETSGTTGKGVEVKDQSVNSMTFRRQFQEFAHDEITELISIDKDEQTYYDISFENPGRACLALAGATLYQYTISSEEYEQFDIKKQQSMSFYRDGDLLTGLVDYTLVNDDVKVINGVSYIVSSYKYEEDTIYQYEIESDGSAYFRVKTTSVETTSYNEAVNGHSKDEVTISVVNFYHEFEMKYNKVKISEIDVSDFAHRGKDELVEHFS